MKAHVMVACPEPSQLSASGQLEKFIVVCIINMLKVQKMQFGVVCINNIKQAESAA